LGNYGVFTLTPTPPPHKPCASGSWQHHGVIQRMQETMLGNPAPLLDQLLVHHADLAGGAAEADEA